jgi:hypothetical protein
MVLENISRVLFSSSNSSYSSLKDHFICVFVPYTESCETIYIFARSSSRFFSFFGGSFTRRWERPPPTYDEAMKHFNPDSGTRPPNPPPYSDNFRPRYRFSRIRTQKLHGKRSITSSMNQLKRRRLHISVKM